MSTACRHEVRRMSRGRRLLVLPLLLASTACGPEAELDITMRGVSITVPRVLTPAIELVPPAALPVPVSLPLPEIPPLPLAAAPAPAAAAPPPVPPSPACPTADPLAVPDGAASVTVKAPPAPGVYVQRSEGEFAGSSGSPAAGSLKGNASTTVAALPSDTSEVGQRVRSWSVTRTDTNGKPTSVEVYQLVDASTEPLASAAGIYLTGLRWTDPVRGEVTFQPTGRGVLVLPLPVSPSPTLPYQYQSSETDPSTLTTLALAGNVTGKKRVDVCGTVVDTFTVELTGTLTSLGAQYQLTWRKQLATHLGAADLEDELAVTGSTGLTWKRLLRNTTVPPAPKA